MAKYQNISKSYPKEASQSDEDLFKVYTMSRYGSSESQGHFAAVQKRDQYARLKRQEFLRDQGIRDVIYSRDLRKGFSEFPYGIPKFQPSRAPHPSDTKRPNGGGEGGDTGGGPGGGMGAGGNIGGRDVRRDGPSGGGAPRFGRDPGGSAGRDPEFGGGRPEFRSDSFDPFVMSSTPLSRPASAPIPAVRTKQPVFKIGGQNITGGSVSGGRVQAQFSSTVGAELNNRFSADAKFGDRSNQTDISVAKDLTEQLVAAGFNDSPQYRFRGEEYDEETDGAVAGGSGTNRRDNTPDNGEQKRFQQPASGGVDTPDSQFTRQFDSELEYLSDTESEQDEESRFIDDTDAIPAVDSNVSTMIDETISNYSSNKEVKSKSRVRRMLDSILSVGKGNKKVAEAPRSPMRLRYGREVPRRSSILPTSSGVTPRVVVENPTFSNEQAFDPSQQIYTPYRGHVGSMYKQEEERRMDMNPKAFSSGQKTLFQEEQKTGKMRYIDSQKRNVSTALTEEQLYLDKTAASVDEAHRNITRNIFDDLRRIGFIGDDDNDVEVQAFVRSFLDGKNASLVEQNARLYNFQGEDSENAYLFNIDGNILPYGLFQVARNVFDRKLHKIEFRDLTRMNADTLGSRHRRPGDRPNTEDSLYLSEAKSIMKSMLDADGLNESNALRFGKKNVYVESVKIQMSQRNTQDFLAASMQHLDVTMAKLNAAGVFTIAELDREMHTQYYKVSNVLKSMQMLSPFVEKMANTMLKDTTFPLMFTESDSKMISTTSSYRACAKELLSNHSIIFNDSSSYGSIPTSYQTFISDVNNSSLNLSGLSRYFKEFDNVRRRGVSQIEWHVPRNALITMLSLQLLVHGSVAPNRHHVTEELPNLSRLMYENENLNTIHQYMKKLFLNTAGKRTGAEKVLQEFYSLAILLYVAATAIDTEDAHLDPLAEPKVEGGKQILVTFQQMFNQLVWLLNPIMTIEEENSTPFFEKKLQEFEALVQQYLNSIDALLDGKKNAFKNLVNSGGESNQSEEKRRGKTEQISKVLPPFYTKPRDEIIATEVEDTSGTREAYGSGSSRKMLTKALKRLDFTNENIHKRTDGETAAYSFKPGNAITASQLDVGRSAMNSRSDIFYGREKQRIDIGYRYLPKRDAPQNYHKGRTVSKDQVDPVPTEFVNATLTSGQNDAELEEQMNRVGKVASVDLQRKVNRGVREEKKDVESESVRLEARIRAIKSSKDEQFQEIFKPKLERRATANAYLQEMERQMINQTKRLSQAENICLRADNNAQLVMLSRDSNAKFDKTMGYDLASKADRLIEENHLAYSTFQTTVNPVR